MIKSRLGSGGVWLYTLIDKPPYDFNVDKKHQFRQKSRHFVFVNCFLPTWYGKTNMKKQYLSPFVARPPHSTDQPSLCICSE